MSKEFSYRVVGVRREGTRVLLGERLTLPRAESIRDALADLSAFREIMIEVESGDSGCST